MSKSTKYLKLVEWSDIDSCYIGSCPKLFYGGCHGKNEHEVFKELCNIIAETVELYKRDSKLLPEPLSGKEFVNALQSV